LNNDVARELLEAQKEIVAAHRDLVVQLLAHTQVLSVLLNVIDESALSKAKKILEALPDTDELSGLRAEALELATDLVSLSTEPEGVKKVALRVIPGGKFSP
jgi:Mg/Co/Ni transporter MgtE